MEALILPCTQEKVWHDRPDAGRVRARDAYVKPCFLAWRQYAENSGSPWFVLSTRYGLILPDHLIENYNVPVSAALQEDQSLVRLGAQGEELGLGSFDRVVLLDWERFQPLVKAATARLNVPCVLRHVCF
jgi:hypothetical protein